MIKYYRWYGIHFIPERISLHDAVEILQKDNPELTAHEIDMKLRKNRIFNGYAFYWAEDHLDEEDTK